MNITDVRVRKVEKEGKMKAVVSITIDHEFVIHDIKVIEGVEKMRQNDIYKILDEVVKASYNRSLELKDNK